MKVQELFEGTIRIKRREPSAAEKKAQAFIERMYKKYPRNPLDGRQFVMVWGEGDEQELAMFELETSASKDGAVEVKWFQAWPQRKGVGSRALKELQAQAKEEGTSLTLFPWEHGRISQAKLIKFYKSVGFNPIAKGSKVMHWSHEE